MAVRFRRSVNLGGGAKLNVNKKSLGVSFGTKGARTTFNTSGRRTTSVGIPGTGLYYIRSKGGRGSSSAPAGSSGESSNEIDYHGEADRLSEVDDLCSAARKRFFGMVVFAITFPLLVVAWGLLLGAPVFPMVCLAVVACGIPSVAAITAYEHYADLRDGLLQLLTEELEADPDASAEEEQ